MDNETTVMVYDLVPCSACGERPEMTRNAFGYSIVHPCVGLSLVTIVGQPTPAVAAKEWESMQ